MTPSIEPQPHERRAAVAALLRRARERLALTEAQVADRVGVTRESVAHWEAGRKLPKASQIRTADGAPGPLAVALELDWQQLANARARDAERRRQARILGVEAVALLGLFALLAVYADTIADTITALFCQGLC